MVPTGEILGDTSVVDNACDLAHIHSVRSIRSENIDGEFCAGLDGKPSDMNCSVMASKVGALAVGAKEMAKEVEACGDSHQYHEGGLVEVLSH